MDLQKQVEFMIEVDKLKNIYRQSKVMPGERRENDAEHSWSLAMLAVLLKDYSDAEIDLLKVIKMVLVHDLVEIDAGDTFCYDENANKDKRERELKAAERIFNILPEKQAQELRDLWDEFEEVETPEAKFAAALDRFQPIMLNVHQKGGTWKEHGIPMERVLDRNLPIKNGSKELWEYTSESIKKYFKKSDSTASQSNT